MNQKKRVIVGMSGGVDSSVSAALLKEQGHEVYGLFMKNWDDEDDGVCPAAQDYEDAARVCDKLDIPFYSVNFAKEYWDNVFSKFIDGLKQGFTPNPDILCNQEIKFNAFLDHALSLGADYLATGHYCRTGKDENGNITLLKGLDANKDQSYFLYTLQKRQLNNVLFPIGHLEKSEVRAYAEKLGLCNKNKKDSTGICFIGERKFAPFIAKYIPPKTGEFQTLDGEKIGTHQGHQFFTIGQRKGLGLGGPGKAWFVIKKNEKDNIVYVERGEHPELFADSLLADNITWVNSTLPQLPISCKAKIRYRQADQSCKIESIEGDRLKVVFNNPQRAITPMQSIVFYQGETCLGGAMIKSTL